MNHGLFEEKVKLDAETHVYSDRNAQNYMGFSSTFDFVTTPFFNGAAKLVAAKEGVQTSDIQARWDGQRDEGSRIDDALTLFAASGKVADGNEDIKDALEQILVHYKNYHKTHEQLLVYNETFCTATAIDKVGIHTNRKDSPFDISDFKCFEKMELFEHKGWLKAPFNHLSDTKFIKIAFQLSFGAYHLEQLTGKKVKKLFIHLIKPSTCKKSEDGTTIVEQQIIQCPYLKNDIILLLSTFADEIKTKLAEQKLNKNISILDLI